MKRRVEEWSVEKIYKLRERMSFPEYQRQPNLWSIEKKRLLIDSILEDYDIPKIYLNETADRAFEVVDGTQRLWSIWEFVDDALDYGTPTKRVSFSKLSRGQQQTVRDYKLQVTIFEKATNSYLRESFLRLQLGLLLVTGEKLNAAAGRIGIAPI